VRTGEAATTIPVRLSENPRPVKSPTEFGLVRVNVSVEIGGMVPPVRRGITNGLKASLIVGGARTATVAVEVFPNANPAGSQKKQIIRTAKEKIRVLASFNMHPLLPSRQWTKVVSARWL
jgi:hypothetical protein